ncbi:MAG: hypothetical protein F4X12_22025 [Acidobacteriia bacterium]|nr:hypothetical protein [Terriglobia bacterium]
MNGPTLFSSLWIWVLLAGVTFAEQSKPEKATHPASYTNIFELERRGNENIIRGPYSEIDDRSMIAIRFDETKMALPSENNCRVKIRVEAFQTKGGDRDRIAHIDNYVSQQDRETDEGVAIAFKFDDRPYDGQNGRFPRVPDTILDPNRFEEKDVDQIEIHVTNLVTREQMVWLFKPRKLGFRAKTTDSFLFVKRLNTSNVEGVSAVNFAPSPGVTFGGTYLARKNRFVRALRPGIGLNATFLNWKDPTYDPDAKTYLPNTRGSEVNIGMGVQFSLFNNVLVFSYGANLQAERSRWYYGIGLSFVQLGGKIADEIR